MNIKKKDRTYEEKGRRLHLCYSPQGVGRIHWVRLKIWVTSLSQSNGSTSFFVPSDPRHLQSWKDRQTRNQVQSCTFLFVFAVVGSRFALKISSFFLFVRFLLANNDSPWFPWKLNLICLVNSFAWGYLSVM